MIANRQTTLDAMNAFFGDGAVMRMTGIFTLLVGIGNSLHFSQYFYAYFIVSLVISAYLSYGGFSRAR